MIALDTNVLVRFLVDDDSDDEDQVRRARSLVQDALEAQQPVLIPSPVVIETVWILRRALGVPKSRVIELVTTLLESDPFVVVNAPIVSAALLAWQSAKQADFADLVIREEAALLGAPLVYTFDRGAQREKGFAAPPK